MNAPIRQQFGKYFIFIAAIVNAIYSESKEKISESDELQKLYMCCCNVAGICTSQVAKGLFLTSVLFFANGDYQGYMLSCFLNLSGCLTLLNCCATAKG